MKYKVIAAGGTFDHLHDGHKAFLKWLFLQGEKVLLGITSDTFAHMTKNEIVQPFDLRKKCIEEFLQEEGLENRMQLLSIDDIYGPLLQDGYNVDAIGVTEDTYNGAQSINTKRQEKGLDMLPIMKMALKISKSGQPISSTSIRAGEINDKGENWIQHEWREYTYLLPKGMRSELHKPFGVVLSSIPQDVDPQKTITVGDVTTKLFNTHNIGQKISILDFVVERSRLFHSLEELEFTTSYNSFHLKNPAGHIVPSSWDIIQEAISSKERSVIQVEGEEDLLVLVCLLAAPLSYHIFYGQPHVGLVDVEVTLAVKHTAYSLMNSFVREER